MHKAFHGSPFLFDSFNLDKAGDATGIKFGYGVYLTEVEASAVHYSQPRNIELMPEHYLYTVEIPDLTPDNHLISAKPVEPSIVIKSPFLNVLLPILTLLSTNTTSEAPQTHGVPRPRATTAA